MKKLLQLTILSILGFACAQTGKDAAQNETLKNNTKTKTEQVKEQDKQLKEQHDDMMARYENAGGFEKYQEAEKQNDKLIEAYSQNPTDKNLQAVLRFMKENKLFITTTTGNIEKPEEVTKLLKDLYGKK